MKISNLRIESKVGGECLLKADVSCGFSDSKELWFSVSDEYKDWLTADVYDAFMVAALWPCMCYGEDIEIEGAVSKKLYKNIVSYIIPLIKSLRPAYNTVKIKVKSFGKAESANLGIVGTGFSGGIDSFCTLIDKFENESDPEYKINTLFFFHLGQYGNIADPKTKIRVKEHYDVSNEYAKEVNLPFVLMDSNLFEFYKPEWELDAGPLCRIIAVLVFQRALIRYYVSGSYNFMQLVDFQKFYYLDDVSDPFIYSILSTDNVDIVLDGAQYNRSEKTEKVALYEPATRHLNVCINGKIDIHKDKNCSICNKCNRTLITLEALGKLSNFSKVFDIDKYKRQAYRAKCWTVLKYNTDPLYKDCVEFAKANGVKYPSRTKAWLSLFPERFIHRMRRKR